MSFQEAENKVFAYLLLAGVVPKGIVLTNEISMSNVYTINDCKNGEYIMKCKKVGNLY